MRKELMFRSALPRVAACVGDKGMTLAEALTAGMIVFLILGTITSIYAGSFRAWCRGSAEAQSEQKASWAVDRMIPDIRMGMSIVPGVAPYEASFIAVQLPQRAFDTGENTYLNQIAVDAHGSPYLLPGDWVVYYRGDANGNLNAGGTVVWRRLISYNGSLLKSDILADDVVDNPVDGSGYPKPMFIYWPDIYRLRSVEVTITVRGKENSRTVVTTMNGEAALRNQ